MKPPKMDKTTTAYWNRVQTSLPHGDTSVLSRLLRGYSQNIRLSKVFIIVIIVLTVAAPDYVLGQEGEGNGVTETPVGSFPASSAAQQISSSTLLPSDVFTFSTQDAGTATATRPLDTDGVGPSSMFGDSSGIVDALGSPLSTAGAFSNSSILSSDTDTMFEFSTPLPSMTFSSSVTSFILGSNASGSSAAANHAETSASVSELASSFSELSSSETASVSSFQDPSATETNFGFSSIETSSRSSTSVDIVSSVTESTSSVSVVSSETNIYPSSETNLLSVSSEERFASSSAEAGFASSSPEISFESSSSEASLEPSSSSEPNVAASYNPSETSFILSSSESVNTASVPSISTSNISVEPSSSSRVVLEHDVSDFSSFVSQTSMLKGSSISYDVFSSQTDTSSSDYLADSISDHTSETSNYEVLSTSSQISVTPYSTPDVESWSFINDISFSRYKTTSMVDSSVTFIQSSSVQEFPSNEIIGTISDSQQTLSSAVNQLSSEAVVPSGSPTDLSNILTSSYSASISSRSATSISVIGSSDQSFDAASETISLQTTKISTPETLLSATESGVFRSDEASTSQTLSETLTQTFTESGFTETPPTSEFTVTSSSVILASSAVLQTDLTTSQSDTSPESWSDYTTISPTPTFSTSVFQASESLSEDSKVYSSQDSSAVSGTLSAVVESSTSSQNGFDDRSSSLVESMLPQDSMGQSFSLDNISAIASSTSEQVVISATDIHSLTQSSFIVQSSEALATSLATESSESYSEDSLPSTPVYVSTVESFLWTNSSNEFLQSTSTINSLSSSFDEYSSPTLESALIESSVSGGSSSGDSSSSTEQSTVEMSPTISHSSIPEIYSTVSLDTIDLSSQIVVSSTESIATDLSSVPLSPESSSSTEPSTLGLSSSFDVAVSSISSTQTSEKMPATAQEFTSVIEISASSSEFLASASSLDIIPSSDSGFDASSSLVFQAMPMATTTELMPSSMDTSQFSVDESSRSLQPSSMVSVSAFLSTSILSSRQSATDFSQSQSESGFPSYSTEITSQVISMSPGVGVPSFYLSSVLTSQSVFESFDFVTTKTTLSDFTVAFDASTVMTSQVASTGTFDNFTSKTTQSVASTQLTSQDVDTWSLEFSTKTVSPNDASSVHVISATPITSMLISESITSHSVWLSSLSEYVTETSFEAFSSEAFQTLSTADSESLQTGVSSVVSVSKPQTEMVSTFSPTSFLPESSETIMIYPTDSVPSFIATPWPESSDILMTSINVSGEIPTTFSVTSSSSILPAYSSDLVSDYSSVSYVFGSTVIVSSELLSSEGSSLAQTPESSSVHPESIISSDSVDSSITPSIQSSGVSSILVLSQSTSAFSDLFSSALSSLQSSVFSYAMYSSLPSDVDVISTVGMVSSLSSDSDLTASILSSFSQVPPTVDVSTQSRSSDFLTSSEALSPAVPSQSVSSDFDQSVDVTSTSIFPSQSMISSSPAQSFTMVPSESYISFESSQDLSVLPSSNVAITPDLVFSSSTDFAISDLTSFEAMSTPSLPLPSDSVTVSSTEVAFNESTAILPSEIPSVSASSFETTITSVHSTDFSSSVFVPTISGSLENSISIGESSVSESKFTLIVSMTTGVSMTTMSFITETVSEMSLPGVTTLVPSREMSSTTVLTSTSEVSPVSDSIPVLPSSTEDLSLSSPAFGSSLDILQSSVTTSSSYSVESSTFILSTGYLGSSSSFGSTSDVASSSTIFTDEFSKSLLESTSIMLEVSSSLFEVTSSMSSSAFEDMSTLETPAFSSSELSSMNNTITIVVPPSVTVMTILSSIEISMPSSLISSQSVEVTSSALETSSVIVSSIDSTAFENVTPTSSLNSDVIVTSFATYSPTSIVPTPTSTSEIVTSFVTSNEMTSNILPTPTSSSEIETSSMTSDLIIPSSSLPDTLSTITSSPTSSSEVLTSSSVPTTTSSPETTPNVTSPPTTTPVSVDNLVITVIKLRTTDDIGNQSFITEMEKGLASAYNLAYQQQNLTSSRRKRFAALYLRQDALSRRRRAVVNDVEVKITNISKPADAPSNAELMYTVSKSGQTVPAVQAANTLNQLLDQELALELQRVVVTNARPAGASTATAAPVAEDKQLWIIGAVLGPVALLLLIWVVVCLLVRHREGRKDKLHIDNDLHTVKHGGQGTNGEVADNLDYSSGAPGQSNGHSNGSLVKLTSHKQKYNVNPDAGVALTSTPRDGGNLHHNSKGGKKLPKKKGLPPPVPEESEEEFDQEEAERVSQKSTPSKKKTGKTATMRDTVEEEMEMDALDPGFYNSGIMHSSGARHLYSQQTFEDEEEEEFMESVEEERRKNKHRQRLRKKENSKQSNGQTLSPKDITQAAYERAQKEIDQILGPRQSHAANTVPDVLLGDTEKKRSKRRSKRGQMNQGFTDEKEAGSSQPTAESLEEVKSRVHSLLDDAFSLLSNSYSSMGNKVVPTSPNKNARGAGDDSQGSPRAAKSSPPSAAQHRRPELEEAPIKPFAFAPKPGEKLHTPLVVERQHSEYDPNGLISWSPYRVSDEAAHIVLPDMQQPDTKAPAQEKLHTTTFTEKAAGDHGPQYYTTEPGQPIFIHTKNTPKETPPRPYNSVALNRTDGSRFVALGDTEDTYTPYPGLESYEEMLGEAMTTTVNISAGPRNTSSSLPTSGFPTIGSDARSGAADSVNRSAMDSRASALDARGSAHEAGPPQTVDNSATLDIRGNRGSALYAKPPLNLRASSFEEKTLDSGKFKQNGGHRERRLPDDSTGESTAESDIPFHKPPTRNVGSRDERDIITSSLAQGASPKELVDSIREELKSMSSKMLPSADTPGSKSQVLNNDEKTDGHQKQAQSFNSSMSRVNTGGKPVKKPRRAVTDSS